MSEQAIHASARATYISRTAAVAALYGALSLVCILFLSGLAWGPVQFRLSEALVVLALFLPEAVPGLFIGCVIANIANMAISGTGALGLLDVVFGSLATLIGAWFTWRFRAKPKLALLGPVVANAIIVSAYLPIILQGLGFYTIPFTTISLDNAYIAMFIFGVVSTGIGEAAVVYILGLPLYRALTHSELGRMLTTK